MIDIKYEANGIDGKKYRGYLVRQTDIAGKTRTYIYHGNGSYDFAEVVGPIRVFNNGVEFNPESMIDDMR